MASSDLGRLERLAEVRQLISSGEARRLREQAGMSLSETAMACGVDTSTVWLWETRRRRPRAAGALRYLEVLRRFEALTEAAA